MAQVDDRLRNSTDVFVAGLSRRIRNIGRDVASAPVLNGHSRPIMHRGANLVSTFLHIGETPYQEATMAWI
ncbi:hypothetical protein [Paraburkholderia flagellata]|uniref:hypothetical protein n=1 Tax=Paraburkholderia flagellata TaxID=2883241 RepID=UPI001F253035|nr:hypothetical protein [Paraburkholderia flagellata]